MNNKLTSVSVQQMNPQEQKISISTKFRAKLLSGRFKMNSLPCREIRCGKHIDFWERKLVSKILFEMRQHHRAIEDSLFGMVDFAGSCYNTV